MKSAENMPLTGILVTIVIVQCMWLQTKNYNHLVFNALLSWHEKGITIKQKGLKAVTTKHGRKSRTDSWLMNTEILRCSNRQWYQVVLQTFQVSVVFLCFVISWLVQQIVPHRQWSHFYVTSDCKISWSCSQNIEA
jgi:hypothetical protein